MDIAFRAVRNGTILDSQAWPALRGNGAGWFRRDFAPRPVSPAEILDMDGLRAPRAPGFRQRSTYVGRCRRLGRVSKRTPVIRNERRDCAKLRRSAAYRPCSKAALRPVSIPTLVAELDGASWLIADGPVRDGCQSKLDSRLECFRDWELSKLQRRPGAVSIKVSG